MLQTGRHTLRLGWARRQTQLSKWLKATPDERWTAVLNLSGSDSGLQERQASDRGNGLEIWVDLPEAKSNHGRPKTTRLTDAFAGIDRTAGVEFASASGSGCVNPPTDEEKIAIYRIDFRRTRKRLRSGSR